MGNQHDLFMTSKGEKNFIKGFLIILAVIWLLPAYSVISKSLEVGGLDNYKYVLTNNVNSVPFIYYFKNSILVAIGSSFLLVFTSALAGFAFSKINFTGSRLIYNAVLMCLAVSGPIILVPFMYILKNLGLYNTLWAVILPEVTMSLPFGVLMMRNYYDNLPGTLMEASYIDGANIWQVFMKIYFPLGKPAIINLSVLQIMWSFQDFLMPLMYLTKGTLFTATVAVNSFKGAYGMAGQSLGRYNAALVLIAVPAILIFVFAQKYIVGGITSGAIKD